MSSPTDGSDGRNGERLPQGTGSSLPRVGTRVLITGGAGFIGSHLANTLTEHGCRVRIYDSLIDQVHGDAGEFPDHLHADVECVSGDIRDRDSLRGALQDAETVYHLAAAVGVGQSMYQIAHYTGVNNLGTAILLECLAERPVERLVVASSMSVYGEGLYQRGDQIIEPVARDRDQLRRGQWELQAGGEPLTPVPTPEEKTPTPTSVYALSKYDQEKLCLLFGEAYGIPTVALRFFNVYGPYQALSNPYTGVLAIFASRCLNGRPPLIFEDGEQRRDFVSVEDVAQACTLAMTTTATGQAFNVGSGRAYSILEIANAVIEAVGASVEPTITGNFRVGDIRHCFADISKAQRSLGYLPRVELRDGLRELAEWLLHSGARDRAQDNFIHASNELSRRGLTL
jgi:dTDP-L-rhamnose 4-epimerase